MNPAGDPKFLVEVNETEDTEWNDILRQHGVIPERPPSPTAQLEEALEEALQKQHDNRLEGKDFSDLEELEGEEEEEFLEFYKRKRMAELLKLKEREKFGEVFYINKPDYNKEITECSKGDGKLDGIYVFVHLSSEARVQSRLLSSLFQQAARKFPQMKFVEIPGNRAIENYPESNTPTLLVYYRGDVIKNMITLLEIGGNDTKLVDLERLMVKIGSVEDNDERLLQNRDDEDSRAERYFAYGKHKGIKSSKSRHHARGSDSDGDYDAFFD